MASIFQTQTGVTLAGGGGFDRATLQEALSHAPDLIAADGGANQLHDLGETPRHVIGDLDSIRPALRASLGDRVHHIAEQDSTDLDKCLRHIDAAFILGIGFAGARLDHTLAAMTALVRFGSARVLLLGGDDVCLLAPPELNMPLPRGARVSLFPMGRVSGRSQGLEWPIDRIDFAPDSVIGTSNRMADDMLRLQIDAPRMLLLLERSCLPDVLATVLDLPDW